MLVESSSAFCIWMTRTLSPACDRGRRADPGADVDGGGPGRYGGGCPGEVRIHRPCKRRARPVGPRCPARGRSRERRRHVAGDGGEYDDAQSGDEARPEAPLLVDRLLYGHGAARCLARRNREAKVAVGRTVRRLTAGGPMIAELQRREMHRRDGCRTNIGNRGEATSRSGGARRRRKRAATGMLVAGTHSMLIAVSAASGRTL